MPVHRATFLWFLGFLAFVETSLGILLFFGFGNQGLFLILVELILIQ